MEELQTEDKKKKSGLLEFLSIGEVFGYFFRKKNAGQPVNVNIRIMHFINRFAIVVFLGGIIYLILRRVL